MKELSGAKMAECNEIIMKDIKQMMNTKGAMQFLKKNKTCF